MNKFIIAIALIIAFPMITIAQTRNHSENAETESEATSVALNFIKIRCTKS